jgi:hypothetical protein
MPAGADGSGLIFVILNKKKRIPVGRNIQTGYEKKIFFFDHSRYHVPADLLLEGGGFCFFLPEGGYCQKQNGICQQPGGRAAHHHPLLLR